MTVHETWRKNAAAAYAKGVTETLGTRTAAETTRHELATDRTFLGERFITCTCGDVSQGPAVGTIAEQNFSYHQRSTS